MKNPPVQQEKILQQHTSEILGMLRQFLQQVEQPLFSKPFDILQQATLGQHTRHTLEFFQCLQEQLQQNTVNYDKRKRDSKIEQSPTAALELLNRIESFFHEVASDKSLRLEISFGESEENSFNITSSFFREWCYVLEHAVHHMAIIRIGLSHAAADVRLPANFGVAASTLKYHRQQCAQ